MSIAPPAPGSAPMPVALVLTSVAWLVVLALLFVPAPASSQTNPCDAVVEQIAEKIRNNGVKSFNLFVIDRDEPTLLKVVGNCRGGRSLIVYARGSSASPPPESAAPASRSPPDSPPVSPTDSSPVAPSGAPPVPPPGAAAPPGTATDPAAVWLAGEVRECHFVYPKGWAAAPAATGQADGDGDARVVTTADRQVTPPVQNALAASDLQLGFTLRRQRPEETAADVLSRRSWEEFEGGLLRADRTTELLPDEQAVLRDRGPRGPTREEWAWARTVASKGVFDQVGLETGRDPDLARGVKRVDAFPFRVRQQFEGTRSQEANQANVWHAQRRWQVAVALNPEWLSYEMGGQLAERPIYEYRCSIADSFSRDRFKALCSAFIERSTLGPDFPQQRCERTPSGLAFQTRH